jgi:hypothetical protein
MIDQWWLGSLFHHWLLAVYDFCIQLTIASIICSLKKVLCNCALCVPWDLCHCTVRKSHTVRRTWASFFIFTPSCEPKSGVLGLGLIGLFKLRSFFFFTLNFCFFFLSLFLLSLYHDSRHLLLFLYCSLLLSFLIVTISLWIRRTTLLSFVWITSLLESATVYSIQWTKLKLKPLLPLTPALPFMEVVFNLGEAVDLLWQAHQPLMHLRKKTATEYYQHQMLLPMVPLKCQQLPLHQSTRVMKTVLC